MFHSTAPSTCPPLYAAGLTSTSTTRTAGSSRWSCSHCGSTSAPASPGLDMDAVFIAVVIMWTSLRRLLTQGFTAGLLCQRCTDVGETLAPAGRRQSGCGEQALVQLASGRAWRYAQLVTQA